MLNNLLLSVILGIVLIGTLYPIVAAAFGRAAVGRPAVLQQGGGAGRAAAGRGRWRRGRCCAGGATSAAALVERMTWPIAAARLRAGAAVVVFAPGIGVLPLLGLALAAGLAVASVAPLWKRNLRRTPLFT